MPDTRPRSSADSLRVAVEPRRMEILQLLWDEERSVNQLAERVGVTAAAVSQHLSRLREAGLVSVRRDGRYRYYRALKSDMGSLAVVLESFWTERLDRLEAIATRRTLRGRGSRKPRGRKQ